MEQTLTYRVRPGRPTDAPELGPLEQAAAARFSEVGLVEIAGGRPTSEAEYIAAAAQGHLWVVEDAGGSVIALALAGRVDGEGYLAEVSVHPDHGGNRLAAALIAEIEAWGLEQGFSSLFLTTFRDVPWNRSYYERLGFTVLEEVDAGSELQAIRSRERTRGLDQIQPRVTMQKLIGKRP